MSEYSNAELTRIVRELRQEIAEESKVLSAIYADELRCRTDNEMNEETLEKSRALNKKIERCMQLWQELKERTRLNEA